MRHAADEHAQRLELLDDDQLLLHAPELRDLRAEALQAEEREDGRAMPAVLDDVTAAPDRQHQHVTADLRAGGAEDEAYVPDAAERDREAGRKREEREHRREGEGGGEEVLARRPAGHARHEAPSDHEDHGGRRRERAQRDEAPRRDGHGEGGGAEEDRDEDLRQGGLARHRGRADEHVHHRGGAGDRRHERDGREQSTREPGALLVQVAPARAPLPADLLAHLVRPIPQRARRREREARPRGVLLGHARMVHKIR